MVFLTITLKEDRTGGDVWHGSRTVKIEDHGSLATVLKKPSREWLSQGSIGKLHTQVTLGRLLIRTIHVEQSD